MKLTKIAVFSVISISLATTVAAQSTKPVNKESATMEKGMPPVPAPISEPIITLRLPLSKLNPIIYAIRYTQVMTAKDANELADLLINQANDTTLNRPILQKPAQRP